MSLYTNIYWTKRVGVVVILILFLCTGFRTFQLVSDKLTKQTVIISEFKPEVGFGILPKPRIEGLETPEDYKPNEYIMDIVSGRLDVSNGYPKLDTKDPIANVYKIIENQINIETTELPLSIARNANFNNDGEQISSVKREWKNNNKTLTIDGLYKLVEYKNNNLKVETNTIPTQTIETTPAAAKTYYEQIIKLLGIPFSDSSTYSYFTEYVKYDKSFDSFENPGDPKQATHLRINARRIFTNLVKSDQNAQSKSAYLEGNVSNNYLIIPLDFKTENALDQVVEFSYYNWPINQTLVATNQNIQTYPIKLPSTAFSQFSNHEATLISASKSSTGKKMDKDLLPEINTVFLSSLSLEYLETKFNQGYIQPVYVFSCITTIDGEEYELLYYLPAILDSYLQ